MTDLHVLHINIYYTEVIFMKMSYRQTPPSLDGDGVAISRVGLFGSTMCSFITLKVIL